MAVLTLNGVSGSDTCYWDISDLQSPFNEEHYIRAGIASIEVPFDAEWDDIAEYVLDYTLAPASNTKDYTNGSVTLETEQTVYGFAQSSYGLCYPAGEPELWPGVWPELDMIFSLAPTSKSIGALVEGLSYAHSHTRRFIWYLDGIPKAEEAVPPPITQHGYIIAPVYFTSEHRVKVEIYNSTKTVLFFSEEKTTNTLYPTITSWNWTASNGEATAQQTQAAKTALDTVGLVEAFHFKVWDDFIRKIAESREETGQAWLNTYANESSTRVGAAYEDLTVARYNAAVQNIAYPLWSWESDPLAVCYLGRLLVRGTATMGADADTVYAAYLLELARKLNIVIGIYNNTGLIIATGIDNFIHVIPEITLRAPGSKPVSVYDEVYFADYLSMVRSPSRSVNLSTNIRSGYYVEAIVDLISRFDIKTSIYTNQLAMFRQAASLIMSISADSCFDSNGGIIAASSLLMGLSAAWQTVNTGSLTQSESKPLAFNSTYRQTAAASMLVEALRIFEALTGISIANNGNISLPAADIISASNALVFYYNAEPMIREPQLLNLSYSYTFSHSLNLKEVPSLQAALYTGLIHGVTGLIDITDPHSFVGSLNVAILINAFLHASESLPAGILHSFTIEESMLLSYIEPRIISMESMLAHALQGNMNSAVSLPVLGASDIGIINTGDMAFVLPSIMGLSNYLSHSHNARLSRPISRPTEFYYPVETFVNASMAAVNNLSFITVLAQSQIGASGAATTAEPVPASVSKGIVFTTSHTIDKLGAAAAGITGTLGIIIESNLELQTTITWEEPIQTGDELYIRQVFAHSVDGDVLRIEQISLTLEAESTVTLGATGQLDPFGSIGADSDIAVNALGLLELSVITEWLNPVQTEDSLYIRQVYQAAQINEALSLEVD